MNEELLDAISRAQQEAQLDAISRAQQQAQQQASSPAAAEPVIDTGEAQQGPSFREIIAGSSPQNRAMTNVMTSIGRALSSMGGALAESAGQTFEDLQRVPNAGIAVGGMALEALDTKEDGTKHSETLSDYLTSIAPRRDPNIGGVQSFVTETLPEAVTSSAAIAAAAVATRNPQAVGALIGAALGGGSLAGEARRAGASEDVQSAAMLTGSLLGLTEGFGIESVLSSNLAKAGLDRYLGSKVVAGLVGGAGESIQEAIQGIGETEFAMRTFDPDRDPDAASREIAEQMFAALIVGGGAGAAFSKFDVDPEQAEINRIIEENAPHVQAAKALVDEGAALPSPAQDQEIPGRTVDDFASEFELPGRAPQEKVDLGLALTDPLEHVSTPSVMSPTSQAFILDRLGRFKKKEPAAQADLLETGGVPVDQAEPIESRLGQIGDVVEELGEQQASSIFAAYNDVLGGIIEYEQEYGPINDAVADPAGRRAKGAITRKLNKITNKLVRLGAKDPAGTVALLSGATVEASHGRVQARLAQIYGRQQAAAQGALAGVATRVEPENTKIDTSLRARIRRFVEGLGKKGDDFNVTAIDRAKRGWTDSMHIATKAYNTLVKRNGSAGSKGATEDFNTLIRLLSGSGQREHAHITIGLPDYEKSALSGDDLVFARDEVTGQRINIDFLKEPYDTSTEEAFFDESHLAMSLAVAERTQKDAAILGREDRISGIGRQGRTDVQEAVFAKEEAKTLQKEDPAKYDRIQEGIRRYRVYARTLLKLLVDRGRISQESYESIIEDGREYVALQRVHNISTSFVGTKVSDITERGPLGVLRLKAGFASQIQAAMETELEADFSSDDGIRNFYQSKRGRVGKKTKPGFLNKSKGSERIIQNPFVTLMESTASTVFETDRNIALDSFFQEVDASSDSQDIAIALDIKTENRDGEPLGNETILAAARKKAAKIKGEQNINYELVTSFRNGKVKAYLVQPDVARAMVGMVESTQLNGLETIVSPARLLRWSVTHAPQFALRNITKDTFYRYLVTDNTTSIVDYNLSKKYDVDGESLSAGEMLSFFGGDQFGWYNSDRHSYQEVLRRSTERLVHDGKVVMRGIDFAKHFGTSYENALAKGEKANRIVEFNASVRTRLDNGESLMDAYAGAAADARGILDFAVAGEAGRVVNQFLPFTNAAIQGLRRGIKKANTPGGAATLAMKTAMTIGAPSIMMRLLSQAWGYEEEYKEIPAYQKYYFFNVKLGDQWLSIPKPYEHGVMGSGMEVYVSMAMGDEVQQGTYWWHLAKSFAIIDSPGQFLGGLAPIFDVASNHDNFRGNSIIPSFEEGMDIRFRNTDRASDFSLFLQNLSVKVSDATGTGTALQVDARYIDHVIKGSVSYFGDAVLRASNVTSREKPQLFDLGNTGFFRRTAPWNSPSVTKYLTQIEDLGLAGSSGHVGFSDMVKTFYEYDSYARLSDGKKAEGYKEVRDAYLTMIYEYANSHSKYMDAIRGDLIKYQEIMNKDAATIKEDELNLHTQ